MPPPKVIVVVVVVAVVVVVVVVAAVVVAVVVEEKRGGECALNFYTNGRQQDAHVRVCSMACIGYSALLLSSRTEQRSRIAPHSPDS